MKNRKKPIAKEPKKKDRKALYGGNYSQYASTTQSGGRRILFTGPAVDQRKDLSSINRLGMISKSRWAERNSPLYKQVLDEMVIVTVGDGLIPQSHADDPAKAKAYEDYFIREWSRRCDVTGRFTFGQVQGLLLRALIGDGDSFLVKTSDPRDKTIPKVQIVEAHRVGTPREEPQPDCVDGVYLGKFGEVVGYNVYVDGDIKNRFIPAGSMCHVVDLDRASGVRGYPVMQSSLNSVQDQLEVFELEKRAVRDSADKTLILKKQGGALSDDAAASFAGTGSGECGRVAAQMGGQMLVVDTNEDLTQLANNRPSPAWLGMMKAIERDIVKLLPVEYVSDPSTIGGAAVRLIASKVSRVAGKYQTILIDCLDDVWDYVIGQGIANGDLPEDEGFRKKTWITPRDVTVDAGREAAQDRADLLAGLTTASAILGKKGTTHEQVVSTRLKEMKAWVDGVKEAGLPLWMVYQTPNNWLQQGQTPADISPDVAENLDVPPAPEPSK